MIGLVVWLVDLEEFHRGVDRLCEARALYHLSDHAHPTMRDPPGTLGEFVGDVCSAKQWALRVECNRLLETSFDSALLGS